MSSMKISCHRQHQSHHAIITFIISDIILLTIIITALFIISPSPSSTFAHVISSFFLLAQLCSASSRVSHVSAQRSPPGEF